MVIEPSMLVTKGLAGFGQIQKYNTTNHHLERALKLQSKYVKIEFPNENENNRNP